MKRKVLAALAGTAIGAVAVTGLVAGLVLFTAAPSQSVEVSGVNRHPSLYVTALGGVNATFSGVINGTVDGGISGGAGNFTNVNVTGALGTGGNITSGGTISGGIDGGVGRLSAAYISGTLGLAGRATFAGALWILEVDAGTVNAGRANLSTANVNGGTTAGFFQTDAGGTGGGIFLNGENGGDLICADSTCTSYLRPIGPTGQWLMETVSLIVTGTGGIQTGDGDGVTDYLVLLGSDGGFARMYASGSQNASLYLGANGNGRIRVDAPVELRFLISGQAATFASVDAGAAVFSTVNTSGALVVGGSGTFSGAISIGGSVTTANALSALLVDAGSLVLAPYPQSNEACVSGIVGKMVRTTVDGGTIIYVCQDMMGRLAWSQVAGEHKCVLAANFGASTVRGDTFGGFHADTHGHIESIDVYPITNGTGGGQAFWTTTQNWDGGSYNLCTGYSPCASGAGAGPVENSCNAYFTSHTFGGSSILVGYDGGCTIPPQVNVYVRTDKSTPNLVF